MKDADKTAYEMASEICYILPAYYRSGGGNQQKHGNTS
jgi:hypothetical protein